MTVEGLPSSWPVWPSTGILASTFYVRASSLGKNLEAVYGCGFLVATSAEMFAPPNAVTDPSLAQQQNDAPRELVQIFPVKSRQTPEGTVVNVGRTRENDVCVAERGVSRQHARIHLLDGGVFSLADAGSKNGTRLRGMALRARGDPVLLADRDLIELGGGVSLLFLNTASLLDGLAQIASFGADG